MVIRNRYLLFSSVVNYPLDLLLLMLNFGSLTWFIAIIDLRDVSDESETATSIQEQLINLNN